MNQPRAFKLLLLGSLAVGKSSIARRLAFDTFQSDYKSTIGVQLHKLSVTVDGRDIAVVVWDTDGDLSANTLSSIYARGASGALIIADTRRQGTIDKMHDLCASMEDALPGRPRLCVFNKVDIVAPTQQQLDAMHTRADGVAQTSALTGRGVREALQKLVEKVVAQAGMNA